VIYWHCDSYQHQDYDYWHCDQHYYAASGMIPETTNQLSYIELEDILLLAQPEDCEDAWAVKVH